VRRAIVVHVLPLEQEAHEVGRRHRLDLGAQPRQRVAVDARQQRAVAPLGVAARGDVKRPRSTTPSDSSASSASSTAASRRRTAAPVAPP
jgi:hypothetical protein